MDNKEIIKSIEENKIIVILRNVESEIMPEVVEAMYAGGIRLLEITFDQKNDASNTQTARDINEISKRMEGKMFIGAGTVCTEEQVRLAAGAGAKFIISPNTDKAVVELTKKLGLISIPGAFTPSEIEAAHNYGADFVKLFPAGAVNKSYIKAVTAPLNHIKLLIVGGVNAENMSEYFDIGGVYGIGVSTGILDKEALKNRDYAKIKELAESFTSQISK